MTRYEVTFEIESGLVAGAIRDMVAVQFDTDTIEVTEKAE